MSDFDLTRALVAGLLIFLTLMVARRLGWLKTGEGRPRWSWRAFGAIFVVALVANLAWEAV